RLAGGADLGGLYLAILEHQQGRNAADIEARRRLLVVVDVDLDELDAAGVIVRELVHDRPDHLAGAAPFGPEIDQYGDVGGQYLGLEIGIADMEHIVAHGLLLKRNGAWSTRH